MHTSQTKARKQPTHTKRHLERVIASPGRQNLRRRMKFDAGHFRIVIIQRANDGMRFHALFLRFFHIRGQIGFRHHPADIQDLDGGILGARGHQRPWNM